MTYLDHAATAFPKPNPVRAAVGEAMANCANPGRGSHGYARAGAEVLFRCRETALELFHADPERVVLTVSCTHGLNLAIRTLVQPGDRVVISGFEHNAVTRTLRGIGARIAVAGRRLFDPADTLTSFRRELSRGAACAVVTCVSNVFGYALPYGQIVRMCRRRGVPVILDAAQAAGAEELDLETLGADFIAMPGHKGLLGPMGTGLLLCGRPPKPLLFGGTGGDSRLQTMPEYLPDRAEPGTMNVPGFAGLAAGMELVRELGPENIGRREAELANLAALGLEELGYRVFRGEGQRGTVSFLGPQDCEETARRFADRGIALRAGLHCAPLAHRSAGTIETGTVRASFGWDSGPEDVDDLLRVAAL